MRIQSAFEQARLRFLDDDAGGAAEKTAAKPREEFLAEYGLSQNQFGQAIGIPPNRITEIVNNRRRITADTALRLSLYFGNSPEFWILRCQNGAQRPKGGEKLAEARLGTMRKICQAPSAKPQAVTARVWFLLTVW